MVKKLVVTFTVLAALGGDAAAFSDWTAPLAISLPGETAVNASSGVGASGAAAVAWSDRLGGSR